MLEKITYKELREKVKNSSKIQGCKYLQRAPLIHEGFPGTFNLSFTEYEWLKEFGNYFSFDKDFVYSTVQSCIRHQDIDENIRKGKGLWKYLGVFEMADVHGQVILSNKQQLKEVHLKQLSALVKLLVGLGLKKERIYPSYHKGGSVEEVTKGKYSFDFKIPEDTLSKEGLIAEGIPEENLLPDKTRDTFLSLHLNRKTPWGYRIEFDYNIGTKEKPKLLDIATLEYFLWFPVYSGEQTVRNIVGLEKISHTISVGGVGLERLCVAVNGLETVQKVDYIRKFYDRFRELVPELTEEQRYKSGECIRTLHRIQSDVESYGLDWSKHRIRKKRTFLRIVKDNGGEYLDNGILEELLRVHTEFQPWHDNLEQGIKPTIEIIKTYLNSRILKKFCSLACCLQPVRKSA